MSTAAGPALARVNVALQQDFDTFAEASLSGMNIPCYRRSDFRWRWFATRLNTFAYLIDARACSQDDVEGLAQGARDHALAQKGGRPRGLQIGKAAFPVLVVNVVSDELRRWAKGPQSLRFAAALFPVVVDATGTDSAFRVKAQRVGFLYEAFFRELATHVATAARSD